MTSLKTILKRVREELKEKERIRESSYSDMRRILSLSKQAILLIHQAKMKEAKKLLSEARELLEKLYAVSVKNPNIIYGGFFSSALQEYSEASILMNLIEKSKFATPDEIQVPGTEYVLGLADVIGEYRRQALDALREGNIKDAEKDLQMMDNMYVELMGMDESYMLVTGLRRKCDVARKIIEITRGDVMQEVRRNELERYLKRFEKLTISKKQSSHN